MSVKKQLVVTLLAACCGSAMAGDVDEARGLIKQFAGSLGSELKGAMKAAGPVNAIEVCNTKAPGIAQDISSSSGWKVGRTSLKLRNPANKPDDWELKVLNDFEARKAAGEDPKQIDYSEVVEVAGVKQFRYMKAIPTAALCLNCHGSEIKPAVTQKLDALYPTDDARGFKAGDIRGVFTLSKML